MNITNYNYGIKFSDLVDINNPYTTYKMIEDEINSVLTLNCRENYFIDDDNLWNDFIKRFTARYVFRTLSFNTYMNFFIKLNQVFLDNKLILQRMYETKMIEYNPLYSIYKETNNNTKTNKKENENENKDSKGNNELNHVGSDFNYHNGSDNINKTGDDIGSKYGNDNTKHEGNDSDYKLHSDSPRSTTDLTNLLGTDNNYITDVLNNKQTYNSNSKVEYNSFDKMEYNSNIENKYDSHIENRYDSGNKGSYSDNVKTDKNNNTDIDTKSDGVLKGYENSPIDNLEKYLDFVIDCNEYLLSQIDKSHLFMDIII